MFLGHPLTRRTFLQSAGACLVGSAALAACGGSAAGSGSAPPAAAKASTAPPASASPPTSASGSAAASPAASGSASAAASASAIPSTPANAPVSITIATGVPVTSFTPIWLATDQGYFKKYGLNVTLQQIEGVTQAQSLIAGEIQVAAVGPTEVLDSQTKGVDVTAIRQTTEYPIFEIHAAPSVKTVDDLKGKVIAITRVGSSTDIVTRALMAKHGLKADTDYQVLAAGNPAGILAALKSGQVAGGMLEPPSMFKANQAGFPKLVSALDEHIPLQLGLIDIIKSYADQHAEVIYAYLKAESEGIRDFFNNRSLAVSTIAKYTKTDEKTSGEAYDVTKPAVQPVGLVTSNGFKTVQQYGKNTKTRNLDVAKAYDNHYLQALVSSGFIKGLGIKSS